MLSHYSLCNLDQKYRWITMCKIYNLVIRNSYETMLVLPSFITSLVPRPRPAFHCFQYSSPFPQWQTLLALFQVPSCMNTAHCLLYDNRANSSIQWWSNINGCIPVYCSMKPYFKRAEYKTEIMPYSAQKLGKFCKISSWAILRVEKWNTEII